MNGTPLLILSILGLFPCCSLLGPISWFLANKALKSGTVPPKDIGTTNIAKIIGIVGTVIFVGFTIAFIANGGHLSFHIGNTTPL